MKKIFLVRDLVDLSVLTANGLLATMEVSKDLLKTHKGWPVVIPLHPTRGAPDSPEEQAGIEFYQKHLKAKYTKHDITFMLPMEYSGKPTETYADLFREGMTLYEFKKLVSGQTPEPKRIKATRDEYFKLFEDVLRTPKKCVFSEKLMTYDESSDLWNPAVNYIDMIKSEALLLNETREAKFNVSHIHPHFFAFEASKSPEFLVDIPVWDSEDRISAMAYLITLKPSSDVTELAFSELLKEWCALIFQRLHNPMVQNRILVLQGGQGIGKDTWTSMLVDGLGQFCIPLAVVKEDKDTYLNLHRGLIMKISEFDKTAKTEVSTLKDIITAPSTNLRAPYERDSKLRLSRCSFISSANAENLLRDSTGNRRFLIFEIESIQYAYEGWGTKRVKEWQMQCLAQMRHLGEIKYKASPDSWRQMRNYIERQTPEEYSSDVVEKFIHDYRTGDLLGATSDVIEVQPNNPNVRALIGQLAKENGVKYGLAKSLIQSKIGVFRRIGKKRFWVWRIPPIEIEQTNGNLLPEPQEDLPFDD